MLLTLLATLALLCVPIYYAYCLWTYSYWKRKNLPYLPPKIPYGNIPVDKRENLGLTLATWYNAFKQSGHAIGGVYMHLAPMCVVVSPDLIKRLTTEDFAHFTDHATYYNEKADPLSAHLFSLGGDRWRKLRVKMRPTFSTGKMKAMVPLLVECAQQMLANVDGIRKKSNALDIKEIFSRYSTDTIGSCAFGLDCNSFEGEEAEFRKFGRKVFQSSKWKNIKRHIRYSFPFFAGLFGMRFVDSDVTDFFIRIVEDTINYRELNKRDRNDFMQLLMNLKQDPGLSLTQIASQAFGFFIASFETSAILMTYCLYELAVNADVQAKTRAEIASCLAKHDRKITYECLQDMKYLNAVLDETLRKYPPFMFLSRTCTRNWRHADVELKVGDRLLIPIYGLHNDPEYFPGPECFRPERFTEENGRAIVPYTYLPFGAGPRLCIGIKFGLMQSCIGLVALLDKYKFTLNNKTELPLGISGGTVISPKNTIYLDCQTA